MTTVAVLAGVVLAYALVSRRLSASPVTAPMVFVGAGMLAGPTVFDLTQVDILGEGGLVVAEVALAFVLFSDAARIDVGAVRMHARLPARMLGIGMPLTIALGVLAGSVLLGGLEFWEAAIVAAILAPTDAALGQVVVSSPRVPERVRDALEVEAGLNDGLSVPFLTLFVGLALEEADLTAGGWLGFAAQQIVFGALAGAAIGLIGGRLVATASLRKTIAPGFEALSALALAVLAYVLADATGGNGFIASFVAGLAGRRIAEVCGKAVFDFVAEEGQLLSLSVFFVFGVVAIDRLGAVTVDIVVYAVASLTVVRMVPVAIATAGRGLRPGTVAFMGWFGPRGLASIVLALTVAHDEPDLPALDVILAATTLVVLASVVLHGASAHALTQRFSGGDG